MKSFPSKRQNIVLKICQSVIYTIEFNSGEFMGQKFFAIFTDVQTANAWIACNITLILEVNTEIFSDGLVIVKYRTEHGKLN